VITSGASLIVVLCIVFFPGLPPSALVLTEFAGAALGGFLFLFYDLPMTIKHLFKWHWQVLQ